MFWVFQVKIFFKQYSKPMYKILFNFYLQKKVHGLNKRNIGINSRYLATWCTLMGEALKQKQIQCVSN